MPSDTDVLQRRARVTGLIYIAYFVAGAPLMVRSSLIVPADAAATAVRIIASEWIYRLTIVTDLVSYALYLGLAYLFYLLLRSVSRSWALMGTLFTVSGCIVLIVATAGLTAPLVLLTGHGFDAMSLAERQELALLSIKIYNQAFVIGLFLFGIQWLIMGPLFAISRLVPRVIGYLLTAGGVGWVAFSIAALVSPPLGLAMQGIVVTIGGIAEVALALWLLIRGVKPQ